MPLESIIGQENAKKSLAGFIASGKIPHALLFTGPNGCGKRTTAYAFAQAVNCANRTGADACGQCASCRRIANRQDIDVLMYEPTRLGIPKDTAKQIREEAMVTPNSAHRKFLLVDRADTLRTEAANLLLKVFEEPPETTVFVMMTANEHLVLPTIKSRALNVGFRPLSPDEAVSAAGGRADEKTFRFLYQLAKGDVGFILQLAEDKNMKSVFDELEKFMESRLGSGPGVSPSKAAAELVSIAERINLSTEDDTESTGRRKSVVFALEALMVFLDRQFSMATSPGTGTSGSGGAIIDSGYRQIGRGMEQVLEAIRGIQGGGHLQLMIESMVISLRETAAATE